MLDLCKYKNILGEPDKGVHSFRIFNIAIVDVLLTILAAYIMSYFTNYELIYTLIFMFILGIISHRIFCVRTTVDKVLFD
jgi:hypothetical protein